MAFLLMPLLLMLLPLAVAIDAVSVDALAVAVDAILGEIEIYPFIVHRCMIVDCWLLASFFVLHNDDEKQR